MDTLVMAQAMATVKQADMNGTLIVVLATQVAALSAVKGHLLTSLHVHVYIIQLAQLSGYVRCMVDYRS